jgi:hypothetical protein
VRVDDGEAPLATADEPPVEEVLLTAGEMAEQAEMAEEAEAAESAEEADSARAAEEAEPAEPAESDGEPGELGQPARAAAPSGGIGFHQGEPEVMGSAAGTDDLEPTPAEPIASGRDRGEGRS